VRFPCTQCGACCSHVQGVKPLEDKGWVMPSGMCTQYDPEAKTCKVYEDRPMVCNIDKGRPPQFDIEEWKKVNLLACDVLHFRMYGEPRELTGMCNHAPREE